MRLRKKKAPPYWLTSREEVCVGCGHGYAYSVEARCVECDGPFCPLCVIVVSAEPFCSECHGKGGSRWRLGRSGKA